MVRKRLEIALKTIKKERFLHKKNSFSTLKSVRFCETNSLRSFIFNDLMGSIAPF